MTASAPGTTNDWAGNLRAYTVAWGLPSLAVVAGAFADAPGRAVIWSMALCWMGIACLMNARRCGRTHCHYTGPYYLLLIGPVALLGFGILPWGAVAWWALGGLILFGGKIIWWTTEQTWGKYVD